MESKLTIASSPHIHSARSTSRIMLDVIIALCPAAIAGIVIFGWRAALVLAVTVGACVGFEALFNLIMKREQTVGDLSAIVTGLLLGMNLPANVPIWQCFVGALFAMVVVKGLFGGLGNNPVNPAITARVFMLVAFGSMTKAAMPTIVDTVSSATPLSLAEGVPLPTVFELFIGVHGGAIGETCAAALIAGGIYLIVRRVISWHIPVAFVGTVLIGSFFMTGFDLTGSLAAIFSGGLMLGAIFMATDYVTSPVTPWGKIIFGVGAGIVTFMIRYFGVYPEGVSFAILLMNIVTPYINSWTKHKVFGTGGAKK